MRIGLLVFAAGVALAGCSSGKKDDAAASGPMKREAGNWKTNVEVVKLEIPGAPAEMVDGMKKMMAGASGQDMCLTAEAAAKEDIAKELAQGKNQPEECKFDKRDVSGGKLDVAMTCTRQGQTMNVSLTGTVGPKKTDVVIATTGNAPTGGQMNMEMRAVSEWTGPCKA
jgi:hypothetical protein